MSFSQVILRGMLLVILLVLASSLLGDVIDRDWIDTRIRGQGLAGQGLFVIVTCLLMSLGLSRRDSCCPCWP